MHVFLRDTRESSSCIFCVQYLVTIFKERVQRTLIYRTVTNQTANILNEIEREIERRKIY